MAEEEKNHDASKIDVLSDEYYEARLAEVKERLKPKRFEHTLGVAHTAMELAQTYNGDVRKARLAGLLHDWDKAYDYDEIRVRAKELGVDASVDPYVLNHMPALLHGPTAAAYLRQAYPEIPAEILQAIERHTAAAVGMSDLDMVLYIADTIEPTRDFKGLDELRDAVGNVPLEELFLLSFKHILAMLVRRNKLVNPDSLQVWNYYITRAREAAGEPVE